MPTTVPESVIEATGGYLNDDYESWQFRELKARFPWIEPAQLFWITDESGGSVVVYEDEAKAVTCLNAAEGVDVIGQLLAKAGTPPLAAVDELARTLVILRGNPRNQILTPKFLHSIRPTIGSWLKGMERDASALETLCADPQLTKQPDGRFELGFHVLMANGAVENWTVLGAESPFRLEVIVQEEVKPAGSFSNPLEF